MFEFLKGVLKQASPNKIVLEIGGIGFGVTISLRTFHKLPSIDSPLFLHVVLVSREEVQTLFGFLTDEEKKFFTLLRSVNGIGPKTAMTALGHMEVADFEKAILQGKVSLLSKIPGIGKKTAERVVMELKDKLDSHLRIDVNQGVANSNHVNEAVFALVNLGYTPLTAHKIVQQVLDKNKEISLTELITEALRSLV